MPLKLTAGVSKKIGLLCGQPHNSPSVAYSVMWSSLFVRRYFSASPVLCAT
jgi:hypothetical protein